VSQDDTRLPGEKVWKIAMEHMKKNIEQI